MTCINVTSSTYCVIMHPLQFRVSWLSGTECRGNHISQREEGFRPPSVSN
jgi:hypothetical protein